jgi:hypothetical protein
MTLFYSHYSHYLLSVYVAMHNAARVQVCERRCDTGEQARGGVRGEGKRVWKDIARCSVTLHNNLELDLCMRSV